jgi:hypothetical protein
MSASYLYGWYAVGCSTYQLPNARGPVHHRAQVATTRDACMNWAHAAQSYLDNAITPVSFPVLPLGGGRWVTRTTDRDRRRRSRRAADGSVLYARELLDVGRTPRRMVGVARRSREARVWRNAVCRVVWRWPVCGAFPVALRGEFRAVNGGCMDGLNPCRYARSVGTRQLGHLTERSSKSKPPGNL